MSSHTHQKFHFGAISLTGEGGAMALPTPLIPLPPRTALGAGIKSAAFQWIKEG